MSPNANNLPCSKLKRWSKFWEDFTTCVGDDGKEWAKCRHCDKMFVRSSKSGITHLKNHLKSCTCLRNPNAITNKEKEKSVIGPNSNSFDLVQRFITHGVNGIKDDILDVYEQEKYKFCEY